MQPSESGVMQFEEAMKLRDAILFKKLEELEKRVRRI